MDICPVCKLRAIEPHQHGVVDQIRSRRVPRYTARRVSELERGFRLGMVATLVVVAVAFAFVVLL